MSEIATRNFTLRRRRYDLTDAIILMLYQYPINDEDPNRPDRTPACDRALELLHYEEGIDWDDLSVRNGLIDERKYDDHTKLNADIDTLCNPPKDADDSELESQNAELSKEIRGLESLLFDLLADYCNYGDHVDHKWMSAGETACDLLGIENFENLEKAAARLGFEYTPRIKRG